MNEQGDRMRELIEKSSLGTRSARAARRTVPVEQGRAIARATLAGSAGGRRKRTKIQGSTDRRHL